MLGSKLIYVKRTLDVCRVQESDYKDKTAMRPSYLYDVYSHAGKTESLYWDEALVT